MRAWMRSMRDGCLLGRHLAALPRLHRRGAANTDRDTGLDIAAIREISNYWEQVRAQYAAFESGLQAPASEVYLHEMPGGQFTNLKAQARSLGLEERWHEVAQAYADVNQMFGDIVKVTPSSKVVGDMALMMVAQGLTRAQVEDPAPSTWPSPSRWST
jgi:pyruvate carboxylase